MKPSFYSLNFKSLTDVFSKNGLVKEGPRILFNWHYKKNLREYCTNQSLSHRSKKFLKENFSWRLPAISQIHSSSDQTVKAIFTLEDHCSVEAVLIPFQKKYTACLSSQVGCAMNCSFCFTGKQGFKRNLKTEEIIGQILQLQTWLSENRPDDNRISNVVFMGQGEPLHNFDSVKESIEIMISQNGLSLADHKITVSTAGYLPGLRRWKNEMPEVNIALSLHSTHRGIRDQLIPINRKFPLEEVLREIDEIPIKKKRFVTFEYLLINGINDSEHDAHQLGKLLKERRAFINLIPFNSFPESEYQRPTSKSIESFKAALDQYGMPVTVRKTKGDGILAACGQLNSQYSGAL